MKIKALIFDLDDTLWPVAPVISQAEASLHAWMSTQVPSVVAQYSIDALRERRQALIPTNPRFSYDLWALRHTLLQQVFSEHGVDGSLADEAMQIFSEARNRVNFFDDVMPALDALKQRYILGSISNGFADITAIGLSQYFSVSVAAHQFGCAKPDPKIFLAVIDYLKLSPGELMYIGDDLRLDVQGAQQVGMSATWLNRRGITLENTGLNVKPDLIVKDLQELLRELK
ncbi:HAD family hydrolase [Undibacterium danionis]|uniref:HAD family hydrolase n=1 Tax=Undibacterium danionis TaxID=1812100 RepID=A0ABV6IBP0_9BURK